MVLDSLKNYDRYCEANSLFAQGIRFVIQNGETLPEGKYMLHGEELYVMVVEKELKRLEDAKLEAHKEYIDIQIVLDGQECFAWSNTEQCTKVGKEYDPQNDIMFFDDEPQTIIKVQAGQFLIFFPEDAHAPLIGEGKVRKAIIKVKNMPL